MFVEKKKSKKKKRKNEKQNAKRGKKEGWRGDENILSGSVARGEQACWTILSLSLSRPFFRDMKKKTVFAPLSSFFPSHRCVFFFFFFFNAAKRNALAVHERRKLNEPGEFFAGFDPRPFRWKSSCQQLSAPLRAFVYPGSVAANGEARIMKSRAIDVAVKMLFFVGR